MTSSRESIQEQINRQTSESVKMLFDLTSRMDERIKTSVTNQANIQETLVLIQDELKEINKRLASLESERVSELRKEFNETTKDVITLDRNFHHIKKTVDKSEIGIENLTAKMDSLDRITLFNDGRISKIMDYAWKIAFMVLTGYMYYKFGWNN